jgi:uncharacterized protein involved in type VI secretion and phage assembly
MSDKPLPEFTQARKRLEIHTVLNDGDPNIDALLLIWAKGSEEVSQPYTYNVKMWRLVGSATRSPLGSNRPPIPPADMINTQVAIHVNFKQIIADDPIADNKKPEIRSHVRRCGVFETFNDEGLVLGTTATVLGQKFHIRQYSATIVPAFKMMSYETAYRVFENKTVVDIIDEVTNGFPNFVLNKNGLSNTTFPTIPFCVQYNESTFNFLSRMMAQFGIWYFFDHNRDANANISTMMLGAGAAKFDPCKEHGRPLDPAHPIHQLTEINNSELAPSAVTIKDFQRVYAPMIRRARFGNFNILNPVDPITNFANIDSRGNGQVGRDLIKPGRSILRTKDTGNREPDDDDRFRTEHFAAPVDLKNAPDPGAKGDAPDAQTYASQWMRNREALVARVTGSSRNAALMPGFLFDRMSPPFKATGGSGEDVIGDEEKATAGAGADALIFTNPSKPKPNVQTLGSYVLVHLEFEGVETSYSHQRQDLAEILHDLLFPKNLTTDDVLANSTVQTLNSYIQKAVPQSITDGTMPALDLLTLLPGGSAFGMLGAAIPVILKVIEKLKGVGSSNDFHCSFAAIPIDTIDYQGDGQPTVVAPLQSLPLPGGWMKPLANGPHLAVVIGQDGIKTDPHDIFADALGRVRVRFPWDRKKGEQPGDSFKRGDDTCWVRVSEGWAGRHYGTQFLPRIGQEVIVDFLDGDPDRPVIIGRLYNADRGTTNLPFPDPAQKDTQIDKLSKLPATASFDQPLSGIKTWSIPTTDGSGKPLPTRFHLLRFSDKRGKEQYLIRSQHRLDITAFEKRYESIHSDRHLTVGGKWDKPSPGIAGDYIAHVFRDYHLHVGDASHPSDSGNRTTLIEQKDAIQVKKDSDHAIGGNWSTSVGGQATIDANGLAGKIVLNATTNITLTVGGSSIVITPATIAITSPMVLINSGGPPPAPPIDPAVSPPKDPTAADPGDTLTPPE